MLRFLLKVCIFICFMAVIDLSAGNIFKFRNYVKSATMGKVNHMMNDFSEEVLILGSSRAAHHYNSKIFEDTLSATTYNAGMEGNGILMASAFYDAALKTHKPKLIIYEFTPQYYLQKNDNLQYIKRLNPYFDREEVKNLVSTISPLENVKMQSSLYRLNSYLLGFVANLILNRETNGYNGYSPLEGEITYEPQMPDEKNFETDSLKLLIFEDFIKKVKKDRIRMIFTMSPIYDYPYNNENLRILAQKYDIPVLNHIQDTLFIRNKHLFYDRTHLNNLGADSISKIITHEIKYSLN